MIPLLGPADRTRAHQALTAIADDVRQQAALTDRALPYARAALFFRELERTVPELAVEDLADELLERSLERVAEQALPLALHGGLLEVAWVLADAYEDDDDACSDVDSLVLEQLELGPARSYDLISGLVGMGLYGLKRSNTPAGREIVASVLARLRARSIEVDGGLAFFTPAADMPAPQRVRAPHGYFNLGLAHGVAGVVALASAAMELDGDDATARHLTAQCSGFARHALSSGLVSWIAAAPDGTPSDLHEPANTASWCYGVSGTSPALAHAAIQLRDPASLLWSADQFSRAIAGPTPGLRGACVCHGHASVALGAARLASLCPDVPELHELAKDALVRILDARGMAPGLGGFHGGAGTGQDVDASVLEGSVGIGLTLVAGLSGHQPSWGGLLGWPPVAG